MKRGSLSTILTIALLMTSVWAYQALKPVRYHPRLDPDEVLTVEVLRRPGAERPFDLVTAAEQQAVITWLNAARFIDDNDDLAGPGCGYIDLRIHLRSGGSISLSERGEGKLHVARNGKYYFIQQPELQAFIRDQKAKGGC